MVLGGDINAEVHDDMYGNVCGDNMYIPWNGFMKIYINYDVYDGIYVYSS